MNTQTSVVQIRGKTGTAEFVQASVTSTVLRQVSCLLCLQVFLLTICCEKITHHNNILSHEVESEDVAELFPPGADLGNRVPHVQLEGVSDQGPPGRSRG